jgi:spore maturation protein SpmA
MPAFFKQQVNQWLCISLISLMCFWVVLFYLTNKARMIGESLVIGQINLDGNLSLFYPQE